MGYDCTLHVIDPTLINGAYTDRLLAIPSKASVFDQRPDSAEILTKIGSSLQTDSPPIAARTVAQGALLFSAAELPYHYEREFALSLWNEQPDGLSARVPPKFLGDANDLFSRLTAAMPQLKGKFLNSFDGNYSTGCYVPVENIPSLLKWVERKVKSFPKADRRLFRGLILILQDASRRGLAYWEGTDLPLRQVTMRSPASKRTTDAREYRLPEGHWSFRWHGRDQVVLTNAYKGPTAIINVANWPPEVKYLPEYALSFDIDEQTGRIVSVVPDGEMVIKIRTRENKETLWEIRLRECDEAAEFQVLPIKGVKAPASVKSAAFFDDAVIAEPNFVMSYSTRRVPLLQANAGPALCPILGIPPAKDNHKPFGGDRGGHLQVMRLNDGNPVLFWGEKGYEKRGSKFVPTFELSDCPWALPINREHHGRAYYMSYIPEGPDGAYIIHHDRVALIRRGQKSVPFLPTIINAKFLTPGPAGAIIVDEGNNKAGRLGVIWWPERDEFVSIEPELFDDEDPDEIRLLRLGGNDARLLAVTPERIWAVPIESVLTGPRFNGRDGRKVSK